MAKQNYEGVKTIQIAPSAEEIRRNANVFECYFNGMAIKWVIHDDCNDMNDQTERTLKGCLSTAIAMSGKLWQLPYLLNNRLPFGSDIYVNGKKVAYTVTITQQTVAPATHVDCRKVHINYLDEDVLVTTEDIQREYIKENSDIDDMFYCYVPKYEFENLRDSEFEAYVNKNY